jgi:hypothetical protein
MPQPSPPMEANGWGRFVAATLASHEHRLTALEQRATRHGEEIDTLAKDASKPSQWDAVWQEVIRDAAKKLPWEKAGYGLLILLLLALQGSPETRSILLKLLGAG